MKNSITIFIITFSLFSSYVWSAGTTDSDTIETMYLNGGWAMVRLPNLAGAVKGSKNNPDSCDNTNYYALNPSDANYNSLHSALLAAQMAGKKVHFWVENCGGQNGLYPHIKSIWLHTN